MLDREEEITGKVNFNQWALSELWAQLSRCVGTHDKYSRETNWFGAFSTSFSTLFHPSPN